MIINIFVFNSNQSYYQITTDILITLNEPVQIDQASSSAKNIDPSKEAQPAAKVFEEILKTFNIKDWSLFCAD